MFFICLMCIENEEEQKSIEMLYEKYRYHCLHLARKYTKNAETAEDMVQELFVRIIIHKKEYLKLSCSELEALFVIIIKRIAIDMYKAKKCILVSFDEVGENLISDDISLDNDIILKTTLNKVCEELRKMDSITQKIVYYKSRMMPIKEIAKIMGMTSKNVEVKLYRARKKLKAKLKGENLFD